MKLATILIAAAMLVLLLSVAFAPAQDAPRESAPIVCTEQYAPVCGCVGNVTRTYPNECYARIARAEIVARGPCGGAPTRPLEH